LFRWSGRQARVADPAGYLARWRDRGSAEAAAAELRSALAQPLRQSPPGTRRLIAESADQEILAHGLAAAVDRAVHAGPGAIAAPSSRWWTVIGLAQTIATAAIVLAAIWVGLWIVIRFPADEVVLPALGRIPIPFVTLVLALGAGYVLARLLGAHAGWLGRRWADTLAARIAANVRAEVATSAFVAVDRVDASRRALWSAARGAAEDCRPASAQRGKHLAGEPGA
jgi:hypothetical protein